MKGFRWFIIFMLFCACVINYLDRSALAYVIEPLQESFGLVMRILVYCLPLLVLAIY